MKCIFYSNKSDDNHITKDIVKVGEADIILKDKTSILDPVLRITSKIDFIGQTNYCYIPVLKRFYYISSVESIINGMWELSCKVDVLMSYKDAILEQSAVVSRQEFKYNLLLDDGTLTSYANPEVVTKTFERGFNTGGYTRIIVGAGGKDPKPEK